MNTRERNILMGAENFDPNDRVECLLAVFSANGRQAICDAFLKCAHTDDTIIYAINNGLRFEQIPNPTSEVTLEYFLLVPNQMKFYRKLPHSLRDSEQMQRAVLFSLRTFSDVKNFYKSVRTKTDQLIIDALFKLNSYNRLSDLTEFVKTNRKFLKSDIGRSLFISLTSSYGTPSIMPEMTPYDALRVARSRDFTYETLNNCRFKNDKFFRIHFMIFRPPTLHLSFESMRRLGFYARTMLEHIIIYRNCTFHINLIDYDERDLRQALENICNGGDTRATFESLSDRLKRAEDVQIAIFFKERRHLNEWFTQFKQVGMSDHVLILFTCADGKYLSEWGTPSEMRQLCLTYSSSVDSLPRVPNLTFADAVIIYKEEIVLSVLSQFFAKCPVDLLRNENLRNFLLGQIWNRDTVRHRVEAIQPFSSLERIFLRSQETI